MEFLQYEFIRNALMVGFSGQYRLWVVGTYVVIKRIAFISGSISHTAYGGIGLGYYLGINPMVGATFSPCFQRWPWVKSVTA